MRLKRLELARQDHKADMPPLLVVSIYLSFRLVILGWPKS